MAASFTSHIPDQHPTLYNLQCGSKSRRIDEYEKILIFGAVVSTIQEIRTGLTLLPLPFPPLFLRDPQKLTNAFFDVSSPVPRRIASQIPPPPCVSK